MEPFGSLPLEAGGMDLFHLMSAWGSGGEKRIIGWHCINWQGSVQQKKRQGNVSATRQRDKHRLFELHCFGLLKVISPHRIWAVQSPLTKKT